MAGISNVFTTKRVAEMLGEDEDWLQEIGIEMDPEDGRLGNRRITDLGVENLAQIVEIYKADPRLMARYPKGD